MNRGISFSQRIVLLGCPIDNLTLQETLQKIGQIIQLRKPSQHVVVNVDKLVKMRNDPALREIIAACDIINVDGMPLVWASKLLGTPLKERVAGIDLMDTLIAEGVKKHYRFYFLGARQEVVEEVIRRYRIRYPALIIAGFRNGYWSVQEEESVVQQVKITNPDVLFVAMSSPKKEIFLKKHLYHMEVPFVMGVGGSFDVSAGVTQRAPLWMQKSGLEWLYRMLQEPRRLIKRYAYSNTIFIVLLIRELVKKYTHRFKVP
jgi:N-acetylglucosaminyldiphosphoundecaprenol N-acetyl-beta-D-mannosaminyltransferase